jgi:hypothetical protein
MRTTGLIMKVPFPVSRMDDSPSKSTRTVVAPPAASVNTPFSFTSPEGIVRAAEPPDGSAIVLAHGVADTAELSK